MVVEVSDDDGASWVELETVAPDGAEAAGGWFLESFLVADFVNPTDQFRVRFKAFDLNPPSTVEAGVDGVRLLECAAVSPCPWDLTDDGLVQIEDFLALLAAWGPNPGHPADFNGDNQVGIEDFLALLSNWGACP